jgi:hypothetical protein
MPIANQNGNPLFRRDVNAGFGALLGQACLPAELMENGSKGQCRHLNKGMRQFRGDGERILTPLQRLVRIAPHPQDQRTKGRPDDLRVIAILGDH